jgi:hypothetical protein
MQAFGITRFFLALGLSLGICAGAVSSITPAFAQSSEAGIAALSRALRSYDSGNYAEASAAIEEAFKAGLSKEFSARAILLRAQVNEHNGALARALQDYSSALWMDVLPPSEKKKASDGKQRVIAGMGLNTPAAPTAPAAKQASQPVRGGTPAVAQAAPESSSGGVLGMFDGLFGSSKPSQEPTPPLTQQAAKAGWQTTAASGPATQAPSTASASPVMSASAVHTRPKDQTDPEAGDSGVAQKTARAEKPKPVPPKAVTAASFQPVSMMSAPAANGFLIVFGPATSEAAGQSRARQIKAQLADILVSRELEIEANPAGSYRIVAGPYKAKSAALALCSAMKQRGVACEVTP